MQCTQLILIADDNNDVLNVLTPTLGDFFEVMEARTGKEAVDTYAKYGFILGIITCILGIVVFIAATVYVWISMSM